jgi:hypothetical protein
MDLLDLLLPMLLVFVMGAVTVHFERLQRIEDNQRVLANAMRDMLLIFKAAAQQR